MTDFIQHKMVALVVGMYACIVITFSSPGINRIWLLHMLLVAERGKMTPFAPEDLVSQDRFGRPVPRQHVHSQHPGRIWCLFTGGLLLSLPLSATMTIKVFYLSRCPPSGQSRVRRVAQLLTDGVRRRKSAAGTRPVVLKVARVTGAVPIQATP